MITTTNFSIPGASALSDKLITDYILKSELPEIGGGLLRNSYSNTPSARRAVELENTCLHVDRGGLVAVP